MTGKPIVNKKYKIQRFRVKGGWHYISIPEISARKRSAFGMLRVKGFIDDYEIRQYHLMSMKNGPLFLLVNATIRKTIGKQEGDTVRLVLFEDDTVLEIPKELIVCLKDEPKAYDKFMKLTEGYQKEFISWIYAAKKEETKATRIAATISKVLQGQTLSKK